MSEFRPNAEGVNQAIIRDRLEVFEMIWKDYRRRNSSLAPETTEMVHKLVESGIVGSDAVRINFPDEAARKSLLTGFSPAKRTGITQRVKGLIRATRFYTSLPKRSLQEFFGDSAGEDGS